MLKLGAQLEKKSVTIKIYKFDLSCMEWSLIPCEKEFMVSEKPFASGGFREAFKATSITEGFKDVTWVVKKYTDHTKEILKEMKQTEETHMKKSVQMHYLARNLASQLKEKVEKENLLEFREVFKFNKVCLVH
jgi:predicted transcriptional regulator